MRESARVNADEFVQGSCAAPDGGGALVLRFDNSFSFLREKQAEVFVLVGDGGDGGGQVDAVGDGGDGSGD